MMSTWRQTHRKNGIDEKGRQWSYVATKQGKPRLSASYQGPRRGKKEFSCKFHRDHSSPDPLTPGF